MNNISPIGSNWNDFEKEIFSVEEIRESDLRVALISELINARQELGVSQKKLEALS
ncbi:transcriptional regulator, partial [Testudinibacter sp. TR-2022]